MIGLILLLALFLRLINLNQSLWLDEAIQFKAVSHFSLAEFFSKYMPTDFNPPLSYLVNFGFSRLFGYSETALRLPSVIFGVLTVWLMYKLGGKLAALLLATSGLHLYYSQEARMYALAVLTVTASFYFLKNKRWWLYTLASLAAIYSHYLTISIFPAQFFWVRKKYWLVIILGFLPWLPTLFRQLAGGITAAGTAWGMVVGGVTLKNILLIPVKFLVGRISLDNNYLFAAALAAPLILTTWAVWRGSLRNKLAAAWLFIPAILIGVISLFLPVLAYFRLLFLLPASYWLVAAGSKKIAVGLVILNLVCSGIYLFDQNFHREDWRSLSRSLTNEPVVIIPSVDAALKYYYAGQVVGTDTVPQTAFWYVPYAEPIFDPQLIFRQKISQAGFKAVEVKNFRGNLTLIQYKK